ncbi:hypothetical protein JW824_01335 [bacterium]|nr:hypothetical protein [bacterium]RQV98547.1 MAG: hypothetical protein EH221_01725 [bacterium]
MDQTISKHICIIGSTTIDCIIQNKQKVFQLGGVTTYAGLTFQKHGLQPIIISNLAPKDKCIMNFFHQQQIILHAGKTEKTTTFINRYDNDQRTQELTAYAVPIKTAQIRTCLNRVDHIHLGPLYPEDIDPQFFLSIPKDKVVSCDLQGLVRSVKNGKIHLQSSPHIKKALACSNVIKADENEMNTILESLNMSLSQLQKEFGVKEIVITRGKKGGTVFSESGKEMNYTPFLADKIGDTTGAGDVFFAAYLFARLYQKQNITESSSYASVIAAKQISGNYIQPNLLQSISFQQTNPI